MGGLFDSGTREVKQQASVAPLSDAEATRLAGITGQNQKDLAARKRQPVRTVLGVPQQQVGNTSTGAYGLSGTNNG